MEPGVGTAHHAQPGALPRIQRRIEPVTVASVPDSVVPPDVDVVHRDNR